MTEQGNPRRKVWFAIAFLIVSVVAFGAAFYLLDGMSLIEEYLGTQTPEARVPNPSQDDTSTPGGVDEAKLRLPDGMPQEFALRIWQEQVDSQTNLKRLVDGEVSRLIVQSVAQGADTSVVTFAAEFSDGTSAPGKLGFRKFGEVWYVAYISGMRGETTGGQASGVSTGSGAPPQGSLPSIEDVDIGLLNAILAESVKSASVSEEYATGVVRSVAINDVVKGRDTATLKLEMDETHEEGYGEVILVSKVLDGKPHWFIARFTKTLPQ